MMLFHGVQLHFKILLLLFSKPSMVSPHPYFSELLHPCKPSRNLRSADQLLLSITSETKHKFGEDCALLVADSKMQYPFY